MKVGLNARYSSRKVLQDAEAGFFFLLPFFIDNYHTWHKILQSRLISFLMLTKEEESKKRD